MADKEAKATEPEPEAAPVLKSVTSSDVGEQTETKASKKAKEAKTK